MILKVRNFTESTFADWFSKEKTEEQTTNHKLSENRPLLMARLLVTLLHGTAAMARSGRSIDDLEPIVNQALKAFLPVKA